MIYFWIGTITYFVCSGYNLTMSDKIFTLLTRHYLSVWRRRIYGCWHWRCFKETQNLDGRTTECDTILRYVSSNMYFAFYYGKENGLIIWRELCVLTCNNLWRLRRWRLKIHQNNFIYLVCFSAVKCMPYTPLLSVLASLGCGFDCASLVSGK